MLGAKEKMRRDKQDTVMNFIVLKMLSDAMMQDELENRSKDQKVLGRVQLIDQTIYEMAKRRKEMEICASTSQPGPKVEDKSKKTRRTV